MSAEIKNKLQGSCSSGALTHTCVVGELISKQCVGCCQTCVVSRVWLELWFCYAGIPNRPDWLCGLSLEALWNR